MIPPSPHRFPCRAMLPNFRADVFPSLHFHIFPPLKSVRFGFPCLWLPPLGLNHKNWKIINKKIQLNVKENS